MKRKPVYQPSMKVILLTALLIILYGIIAERLFGQSICVMVGFSGNGIVHTGVQIQGAHKLGIYATSVTDETDGNRKTFNSYDSNLRHLSGFTAGIQYRVSNVHPVCLSLGAGRIKNSSYACSKRDDKLTLIAETFASVQLTKWCDCFFGVNTYPMILSGLIFKISK